MEKHGIKGTVKFFGTPAEETLVGKIFMNRDGVFDGCDILIAWHPGETNGATYSTNLAIDNIKFRFFGKSSHSGTAPEAGRSALDAVHLMNMGMEFMREHVAQEARIHYVITKGGEVPIMFPPFAEVWYYTRSPRRGQVDQIRDLDARCGERGGFDDPDPYGIPDHHLVLREANQPGACGEG